MALDERLLYLLSNNEAPTSLEIASMRHELAVRRNTIAELEKLHTERRMYESLLAPLRCLNIPPEVMGEIFGHVVGDCPSDKMAEQVQALCLVCRSWRKAALAAPRLWATLEVKSIERKTAFGKVRAWTSRAGTLPRKLGINAAFMESPPCDEDCPLHKPDLVMLLAEAPIQHLSIRNEYVKCLEHLFDAVTAGRPWGCMESLRTDLWEWREPGNINNDDDELMFHVFHRFPKSLKSLHLVLPYLQLGQATGALLPLSLPNLTELYLKFQSESWILRSLEGCPNLETVVLDLDEHMLTSDGNGTARRTFPKLHTLRLQHLVGRQQDSRILRLLECPSLTQLDINLGNGLEGAASIDQDPDIAGFAEDVIQFVRQSNCVDNLQVFRLNDCYISVAGLIPIFREVHSVEHLILQDVCVDGSLFKCIEDEGLLPHLEVLDVLDAVPDFDYWKVVDFVTSRNNPVGEEEGEEEEGPSSIQIDTTISIPTSKSRLQERDLRLEALRDNGVRIRLQLGDIMY